jgi:predicted Zn-dependent peptidase
VERLESARILMLWPMAAAVDQHRLMGADLVTTLLGEGRRSRLVAHLREELRIADTVEMDLTVLEQGSLVTLEISCREEDLEAVEHAVTEQMHQLLDQAAQDWELERARRLVRSGMLFSLESAGQVAGIAASQTLWNRDQALLDPLRHLEHWSAEDLREDILPQLQPSRAFTLVARPGGTN